MVYDTARGVILMYGGSDPRTGPKNETWTWNGTKWQVMSAHQPPANPFYGFELGPPMAWNGTDKVAVLHWYGRGVPVNQTWAWDGADWSQLPTTGEPAGEENNQSSIAYDEARKSVVLFGHVGEVPTTSILDGTTWKQVSSSGPPLIPNPASSLYSLAADPAHGQLVLFDLAGATWTWDGIKWTNRFPAHAPSARSAAAMAYDPIHRVVVLFGGNGAPLGRFTDDYNDVWTWNGADWTQVSS
jgi:hypothetical protein